MLIKLRKIFSVLTILALIAPLLGQTQQPALAQGTICATSSPASAAYSATVCFTTPADGSLLAGEAAVTATVSVAGTSPGVQRMVFNLNGGYILTDYQTPYTFSLPTTKWMDGSYVLSVSALMRDGFVTQAATLDVTFGNNINTPPTNSNQFIPSNGNPPSSGQPFTVAAAGDGASGELNAVKVSDLAAILNPNLFIYLGDVYEKGTLTEFHNWYGTNTTNFGRFKTITNPTIGNHEYENGGATGYFDYWNNVPDYYSYDAGGWHFVSLNSNSAFQAVNPLSAQYQWLQQDLSAHAQICTIVYYHHPLFNIGPEGSTQSMADMWRLMAQSGVDIVLNGHDHTYQRWQPLDGNGLPDPNGVTEFVVGASGHGLQTINTSDNRVAYATDANPAAFGVLLLQLNQAGANFSYHSTNGTVLDSGIVPCSPAAADTTPPTAPSSPSGLAASPTRVDLTWSAASDNVGVSSYSVYRNGTFLVSLPAASTTYSDKTVQPDTTYQYTLTAADLAGSSSELSTPAVVTTPPMPSVLIFPALADTYVNAGSPASNFGSALTLRLDGSPDLHAYLRFMIDGLVGYPISQARLFVYSNTTVSQGINLHPVADNTWGELTTNYNNAPTMNASLANSGPVTAGSPVALDVTSLIQGEGLVSFGLSTANISGLSMPSRESGANSPYLLLEMQITPPDTEPPSVPDGLTAAAVSYAQIDLGWLAAVDNSGVSGYTVYRDGAALATLPSSSLAYQDLTVAPLTTYTYTLDAFDRAGNHSAQSAPVVGRSLNLPSTLSITSAADTYVSADFPTTNYGSTITLRADSTPDIHSYLRFDVPDLNGYPILQARLLIFANNNSALGFDLQAVTDNTWGELTTTYSSAPALGGAIASSGPLTALSWVSLDISPQISGPGSYSFGLSTLSPTAISLASRETGSNAPILVIDLENNPPDLSAPSTPANLSAVAFSESSVGLAWDASADNKAVAGYTIYRDGTILTSVTGSSLSFEDINLTPWTTYQYTIDAFDEAGNRSSQSTPVSVTTLDTTPPSAPTGLTATLNTSNQVVLNWTGSGDNVSIAGYSILRGGSVITTVLGSALVFTDASVSQMTEYTYSLAALDQAGNHSEPSSPVSILIPDTSAPTTPDGLTASAIGYNQVTLTWNAALDNVAIAGYNLYREGVLLTTLSAGELAFNDLTVNPGTTYIYTVDGFDQAGNHSAISSPVSVSLPSLPTSLTFTPTADAYVSAASPTTNYGTRSTIRADASPDLHGYLRFNVQGLAGQVISKAQLLFYSANNNSQGFRIYSVADNTWAESTTNYNNAPAFGSLIKSSGAITTGSWFTLDVSSYVKSEGLYNFGFSTPSNTALNVNSRETGSTAPQLILSLRSNAPDTLPPTTPQIVSAAASSPIQVDLSWIAASDNFSVTGYTLYRNGAVLATVSGLSETYRDTTAAPATAYSYSLTAFDAAGNVSLMSASAAVTTPALPASLTFTPVADAYVSASKVTSNYGRQNSLRMDASPIILSYLRFSVQGLYGQPITKAYLLVNISAATSIGFSVYAVADNTWGETSINYSNAPPADSLLASSGPAAAAGWIRLDVTPYINGEGTYSFRADTISGTLISLAARETGATAPQLILEFR